jgi:hypothetical protein
MPALCKEATFPSKRRMKTLEVNALEEADPEALAPLDASNSCSKQEAHSHSCTAAHGKPRMMTQKNWIHHTTQKKADVSHVPCCCIVEHRAEKRSSSTGRRPATQQPRDYSACGYTKMWDPSLSQQPLKGLSLENI